MLMSKATLLEHIEETHDKFGGNMENTQMKISSKTKMNDMNLIFSFNVHAGLTC